MPCNRFESIYSALNFTAPPPSYQDNIYEAQQIIVAWNGQIQKIFIPSWISCLDESMPVCMYKFMCLPFSSALTSLIQRVTVITPYYLVKLVSCMAGRLIGEGII